MPSHDKWELPVSALAQRQELGAPGSVPLKQLDAETRPALGAFSAFGIMMALIVPDEACAGGARAISRALIASLNSDLSLPLLAHNLRMLEALNPPRAPRYTN